MAFSVSLSICTSVRLQESRISHSARRALKLLFNHFQSMLWDSKRWHSGPWLGSLPGAHFRTQRARSVICHCKGQRKWAVFKREDTVSSHNYISPVFTDLFTEERKDSLTCGAEFQGFFFFFFLNQNHFFFWKVMWTKCLSYKLWNVIQITVEICNLHGEMWLSFISCRKIGPKCFN